MSKSQPGIHCLRLFSKIPDPRGIEAFFWRSYLNFDIFGRHFFELVQQPVAKSFEQSRTARQHYILVQIFPQIHVRLENRIG